MIKKYLALSLLAVAAIVSSCTKEKGCTDSTAKNYSATAEVDDNSCLYPTVADRVLGSWTGKKTVSVYYLLDASEEETDIEMTFNEDGTGSRTEDGTTEDFTWEVTLAEDTLVQNDKITLKEAGEEMTFDIYTDTETEQKWEHLAGEMVNGSEKTTATGIKLNK